MGKMIRSDTREMNANSVAAVLMVTRQQLESVCFNSPASATRVAYSFNLADLT